jgi:hypothetical protein
VPESGMVQGDHSEDRARGDDVMMNGCEHRAGENVCQYSSLEGYRAKKIGGNSPMQISPDE